MSTEDGRLTVAEVDVPYADSARLWLGYWRYSAEFERVDGAGFGRGNDGWYLGSEAGFRVGSRAAKGFIRLGQADERFNVLAGYLGLGAVVFGPFESRQADRLGIAVATARTGDRYRDQVRGIGGRATHRETAWELTYRLEISDRLSIQPDVQYVRNPSLSPDIDSAWVAGCRFEIRY